MLFQHMIENRVQSKNEGKVKFLKEHENRIYAIFTNLSNGVGMTNHPPKI